MATSAAYIDLTEASAPATPSSGEARLYVKADGLLYWKDDAGTEHPVGTSSSSVATDPIWDAAGDIVQGTGANTAARLALGAAGTVVTSTGSTNAYVIPAGAELDYVQITSPVTVSGTTEGASTTVITGTSQAYAAVPTIVEVFLPRIDLGAGGAGGNNVILLLYDGATLIGRLGVISYPANAAFFSPFFGRYRLTPTAATHQYIVKGTRSNANVNVEVGSGGTGAQLPGFLRVTKV